MTLAIGDVVQTRLYRQPGYEGRLIRITEIQVDLEAGMERYFGRVVRRDERPGKQRLQFSLSDVVIYTALDIDSTSLMRTVHGAAEQYQQGLEGCRAAGRGHHDGGGV